MVSGSCMRTVSYVCLTIQSHQDPGSRLQTHRSIFKISGTTQVFKAIKAGCISHQLIFKISCSANARQLVKTISPFEALNVTHCINMVNNVNLSSISMLSSRLRHCCYSLCRVDSVLQSILQTLIMEE